MAPPIQAPPTSSEVNIHLAISAINRSQIQSIRDAAQTFEVPRTTLRRRRAEEVIISHILQLDQRGFAPTYAAIRDMADKLLAARGAGQVRQKWLANFVKPYDRQRALCEDPALIRTWFKLVEETKAKYSICDKDVYNFNKAGFIIGKITTQLVIIGAERRGRPKTLQLGNREWVTLIAAISAAGWSVPPFLIFAGQYHLSAWYEEAEILRD
ncbi:hypothetical protein PtrM4_076640 [Pyrenophora tritici-repentis]|uniref:HTH CENPB-type domain-containing protein n=1 Tax=Pyrenophora tritici-repentis TaxID=45151 RepID=A0A834RZE5_9PLEO|nr:hypothetical protein PtrM4_076640 [Pyrenophora tritici-repentis]